MTPIQPIPKNPFKNASPRYQLGELRESARSRLFADQTDLERIHKRMESTRVTIDEYTEALERLGAEPL